MPVLNVGAGLGLVVPPACGVPDPEPSATQVLVGASHRCQTNSPRREPLMSASPLPSGSVTRAESTGFPTATSGRPLPVAHAWPADVSVSGTLGTVLNLMTRFALAESNRFHSLVVVSLLARRPSVMSPHPCDCANCTIAVASNATLPVPGQPPEES